MEQACGAGIAGGVPPSPLLTSREDLVGESPVELPDEGADLEAALAAARSAAEEDRVRFIALGLGLATLSEREVVVESHMTGNDDWRLF